MTTRATWRLPFAVVFTTIGSLIAVLTGYPGVALLATPWAALLVLGLSHRPPRVLHPAVEVSTDRLIVGDTLDVTSTVSDVRGIVTATCRPSGGFTDAESGRVHGRSISSASGSRSEMKCRLRADDWGTHDVGAIDLEHDTPYGLFRSVGTTHRPVRIRIHPDPVELRSLLAPRLVRRHSGVHQSGAIGRGVEYADARPFTSGDALRDVNWRLSARSDDLWVSDRHPDRSTDVILLLDSFIEAGHDVRSTIGMAIEAAVAIAESHLGATDRVGLIEIGGTVRWVRPGTGPIQLQRLTDAMLSTSLYASAVGRDLDVISPQALPPRSFIIALSPLLDERFVESLMLLAGRGHDVAVIECLLPTSEAASPDNRISALAHRLVAAERQIARDRLTAVGIALAPWHRTAELEGVLQQLTLRRRYALTRALR